MKVWVHSSASAVVRGEEHHWIPNGESISVRTTCVIPEIGTALLFPVIYHFSYVSGDAWTRTLINGHLTIRNALRRHGF